MLAPFLALRPSALGSTVCSFASGAAWRCQSAGILMEASPTMAVALSTTSTSTPSHQAATSAKLPDPLDPVDSASCSYDAGFPESTFNTPAPHIGQPATGWRALRWSHSNPSSEANAQGSLPTSRSPLAAPGFRHLHTASPCTFAAAPATASASSDPQRSERTKGNTRSPGKAGAAGTLLSAARPPVRRQPVSRQANEFQRMFFQLINHNVATSESPAPSSALINLTNSQAIRLLLAWIEEGRATRAAEGQQQGQAGEQQGAVAAEGKVEGAGSSGGEGGGVADAYRLEQQVFDRATEVLWRLYLRDDLLIRSGGRLREKEADSKASGGAEGPMGLRELMTAAEELVGAAEVMGMSCRRSHFDLVLELYNKMAMVDTNFRSGLAKRALNVRQRMVQQLLPLSQASLNNVLTAVRQDPEFPTADRMSTVMKLLDRDLPVLSASASGQGGQESLFRLLPGTLHALMKEAAREGAWPAYHKLEAVLVTRTRSQPPYDVLLEVLGRAVADGERGLALGALTSIEQLESSGNPPTSSRPQQPPRRAPPPSSQPSPATPPASAAPQTRTAGPRGRTERWGEDAYLAAQRQSELSAVRGLFAAGVEAGEEAVAEKAYERIRQLMWREGVQPAAEGQQDKRTTKEPPPGPSADELKPAPLTDILALLRMALARRDWPRVLERVTALAELQSLSTRADHRFRRLLRGANSVDRSLSAYGGLGPLSKVLMDSEQDTVAYYSELLRRVGEHAATATSPAPFAGSPVAFGPALRAAASRKDLVSVSEIVKQMRGLGCAPGGDAFAAVMDASLRAGKPERVAGLMELMADEGVVPTAAVWEVQLRAATEAQDAGALGSICERALLEAERSSIAAQHLAGIPRKVLSEAAAVAEALADTRAVTSLKLLRNRVEDQSRDGPSRSRERS